MIKFPAMRRRSLGSPQQCYADDGMWMDTHAQQQQQSYAFHEESWNSDNNSSYHKQQFPAGMHMKKPNGHGHGNNGHHGYGMFENMPNGHHGHGYGYNMHDGGKKLGGNINSSHHHQFPNGVATKFNSGGHHHGYSSEESCEEYEEYSEEMHHGAGKVKMDEMRYEHHNNWGRDHAYYANPYDHNMNMHGKPHGHGGHRVEWIAKGV